jgi:hypothetical protein
VRMQFVIGSWTIDHGPHTSKFRFTVILYP